MSVLINVTQNEGRKNLPGKFLLVLALFSAASSFYVFLQAGERVPLSQIQDLALISTVFSLCVAALVFFVLRRVAGVDFQAQLVRQFFEEVEDPIFFLNKFGRPVMLNTAGRDFLPRIEDSLTEQLKDFLLKEDTEGYQTLERLYESITSMRSDEEDLLIMDKTGEMQRLLISIRPMAQQNLSIVRLVDLSRRSSLISSAQHGLSKLIQILDHVPIGLYALDDKNRIIAINGTLSTWLGATPSEIISKGRTIESFLIRDKSEEEQEGRRHSTKAEEVAFSGLQGQMFHAFLGRVSIGAGDQQLRGGLVLREDSGEGDWQTALRRSKLLFKRFFEEAPVGIVMVDLDGRVSESNRQFRDIFGEDVTGSLIKDFVMEDYHEPLAQRMAEAISLGDTHEPVELMLKSDPPKITNLYVGRMEDDQETAFGLMLHLIDVTEQKNLEQQFVQSQKMQAVGQLAGGVAHDFNNLLTAMIGYCDLLMTRHRPGDPSFADINQIKQNANRAANLVRQLLAFSRQQRLTPKVINVTDILAELSNLLTRLLGENVALDMHHARDLWPIKADQGQLEQVIINLSVNARDAMDSKGTLTIKTENKTITEPYKRGAEVMPKGDYIEISVSDTGHGISQENLERIFEPFFSTKDVGSGTGLGLSTVYGIVKQTDGYIYVDSTIDQSTTFRVYIPRYEADGKQDDKLLQQRKYEEADLTGTELILFAEDEDPVRSFTSRALTSKGYEVVAKASGEDALKALKELKRPIDLLITDVMMPGMDGPTLIGEVRKIQPEVKVLCISGYSEDALRKKIEDDSEVHFLAKPFSLKDIATQVKEILNGDATPPVVTAPLSPPPEAPPEEAPPIKAPEELPEELPGELPEELPEELPVEPPVESFTQDSDLQDPVAEEPVVEQPAAEPSVPSASELPEGMDVDEGSPPPVEKTEDRPIFKRKPDFDAMSDQTKEDEKTQDPVVIVEPKPEISTQPPAEEKEKPQPTEDTGKKLILFAEDEDPVRMFTTRALTGVGYEVVGGGSAELALEEYEKLGRPVDLLITDVMMPGMDGPELIGKMREIQPGIKVLCISGYSEGELRDKIADDTDVHFLAKPFTLKAITEKVGELLEE